jgi:hypothetical protein
VSAVLAKLAGVATYLAFVAGLGTLCVNLSSHFATHAMVLATPLFVASGERQMTLVERRQIEAAVVIEADPVEEGDFIPDAPSTPLPVLAAQMDLSETADLQPERASQGVARPRTALVGRKARVAAADVFGRSFGVMVMASR